MSCASFRSLTPRVPSTVPPLVVSVSRSLTTSFCGARWFDLCKLIRTHRLEITTPHLPPELVGRWHRIRRARVLCDSCMDAAPLDRACQKSDSN